MNMSQFGSLQDFNSWKSSMENDDTMCVCPHCGRSYDKEMENGVCPHCNRDYDEQVDDDDSEKLKYNVTVDGDKAMLSLKIVMDDGCRATFAKAGELAQQVLPKEIINKHDLVLIQLKNTSKEYLKALRRELEKVRAEYESV